MQFAAIATMFFFGSTAATMARRQGCSVASPPRLLAGEPTLHPCLLDIVAALEPKKNIVAIATNCITLTEEMIVELKRLGVFVLYVSINSTDAEINDVVRGYRGHHDHVMRVIESCKRHGIDVMLPITTSKELLPETIGLLDFARRHGISASMGLLAPTGRQEGRKENLFDESFWAQLRELYNENPGLRGDWDTNFTLKIGCPAGYEKIHVSPYGHVTGCAIQPMAFGSLRDERLSDVVERMREFSPYKRRPGHCIATLDAEFIGKYVDPAMDEASTPYPIESNPCYAVDCGACERATPGSPRPSAPGH